MRRCARGFTLLELLVVMVIAGITLGLVSFNAMPSERQVLQNEAQRVALLLQLARDEAIVRNRPVAVDIDGYGYRFWIRDDNKTWVPFTGDDMLRERQFNRAPLGVSIDPPTVERGQTLRIVFGREPVDRPFALSFSMGNSQSVIRADGIGNFAVE